MQKQDTTTANKKIDYLQKGVDNLLCLVYNASRKVKGKIIMSWKGENIHVVFSVIVSAVVSTTVSITINVLYSILRRRD